MVASAAVEERSPKRWTKRRKVRTCAGSNPFPGCDAEAWLQAKISWGWNARLPRSPAGGVFVLEVGMRLFFICAYAVAVYADLYAHIRKKPNRKICIVYVDIRIYADKLHMLIWKVNSSVPPDQINDFENVNCTNCECSFMLSDDLIPHNQF